MRRVLSVLRREGLGAICDRVEDSRLVATKLISCSLGPVPQRRAPTKMATKSSKSLSRTCSSSQPQTGPDQQKKYDD